MKTIHIKISLPEDLPAGDEELIMAQNKAKEAAIISLWQSGKLSLRQSAKALGITYRSFLQVLEERGIPVISEGPDEKVVKAFIQHRQKEDRRSAA